MLLLDKNGQFDNHSGAAIDIKEVLFAGVVGHFEFILKMEDG